MITLFERFNTPSIELFHSLNYAGIANTTFVIEDDGFLPDEIITPYQLFANPGTLTTDQPVYFNRIDKPRYWEISGNNEQAELTDQGKLRAKIAYKSNFRARIVQQVQWLNEDGTVRTIEHYSKRGYVFARTVFDEQGKKIFKTYLSRAGDIVIYENYVTNTVMLNKDGQEYMFANKTEFVTHCLAQLAQDTSKIIFNSLGTPLLSIVNMKAKTNAYLFWQESIQEEIPGNMKYMLDAQGETTFKVVVPHLNEYNRLKEKVDASNQHKIVQSGYLYRYHKKNQFSKHALVVTNSDQLHGIEAMIRQCPEYTFSIAAITEMSSNLMNLGKYKNVNLYPLVEMKVARKLYESADLYLDINRGNEILNAVRSAFDYDLLIMGYQQTAHNRNYTASELLFDETEVERLIQHIQRTKKDKERLLNKQKAHANEINVPRFKAAFDVSE